MCVGRSLLGTAEGHHGRGDESEAGRTGMMFGKGPER